MHFLAQVLTLAAFTSFLVPVRVIRRVNKRDPAPSASRSHITLAPLREQMARTVSPPLPGQSTENETGVSSLRVFKIDEKMLRDGGKTIQNRFYLSSYPHFWDAGLYIAPCLAVSR